MLTSTAAYKIAIAGNTREMRITGTLTLLDNTVYQVADSIIKRGSLYIDEQCVSGEDLQIGNVYAAEMGISLELGGISASAVDGAVLDLDYGIVISGIPVCSGTVFSEDSGMFDFNENLVPGIIPASSNLIYKVKFTSGALSGNFYTITDSGPTSWNGKDWFGCSSLPAGEPDNGDTFEVYTILPVWEDQPLGVYNVIEPKRNGLFIDIIALDNLRRGDSTMWVTTVPSTPQDNIIAAVQTISYKPAGSVANSISSSDKLQITVNNQQEGAIKTYWVEKLYQNATDDLSITITPHVYPKYTMVDIKVYLAKTTPGKNTAALIQAAIRALSGTYPNYSLNLVQCAALGNWDTTTTGPAAFPDYMTTLLTQYSIATTTAEFNTYPNYDLLTNYSNYVSSRDMIMWMCSINSTFARMSRTDQLEILPLHKATADRTIAKSERYKTTVSDSIVKVTAIQMTINGVVHVVGVTGPTMELPENPFMIGLSSASIDTALTNILNDITLAEYKPFEIEFIGDPTLQPGDWITIEDAPTTGGDPTSLITHSIWRYRGRSVLSGKG